MLKLQLHTRTYARTHTPMAWVLVYLVALWCCMCRSMVGVARPKQRRRGNAAKEPPPKQPRADPEFDAAKRACLVVGLRATVRSLERGVLCAGVLCLSTCPILLQQHVLTLVAVREIPFIALHDLSPTLAPLLGVSSVAALGFTASGPTHFPQLLDTLQREAPAVHLPWLCTRHHSRPARKEGAGSTQESGWSDTPSKDENYTGGQGKTSSKGERHSGGWGTGIAGTSRSVPSPLYCAATLTKVPTTPNARKMKRRRKK